MGFWREEFSDEEIGFLFDQVRKFRVRNDDGRITLTGAGNYDGWAAILVSAVGLEVRTDALRTRIVRAALFSEDLPLDFSENDFRKIAYRLRHQYQEQELKSYRVAFPVWNLPSFLQGTKKKGDVTLPKVPNVQNYRAGTRKSANPPSLRSFLYERSRERLAALFDLFSSCARQQPSGCKRASFRSTLRNSGFGQLGRRWR